MISWPKRIRAARLQDLAASIDIVPTVLRACGIRPSIELPGVDLLDVTARGERDAIFGAVYAIHNMNPGDPTSTLQYRWCIENDWKLMLRTHGDDTTRYRTVHQWDRISVRLYNVTLDPFEQSNQAETHEGAVRRLTERINATIPIESPR